MSTPEYNSRQSGDSTMGSSYGAASDVYSSIEGPTFADKPIGGGANGQLVGAQVKYPEQPASHHMDQVPYQTQISALQITLAERNMELQAAQQTIQHRDEVIAGMEQQESEMQEQMWELQEAVARGERDISLLKLTISHKDEEIVRLQATAQGADGSTVDSLARQKDELEAVISELEASLKEVSAGAAREREEGRRRELAFEEERSEIVAYVEELKALVAEQKAHAAEQLSVIQELEDARDNASQQVSNLAEELTKETSRRGSLEMTLAHHQAVIEELRATGPPQLTAAPEQSSQSILALPAPPAGDVAPATHPLTVVVSVDVQPRREAPVSPAPWPMPPTVPPEGLVIKGVAQEVIPSVHRKVKEQVFALENAPLAPDSGGEEQMHDDWLMVPTGLPTASHEVGNRNDSDDAEARRETWSVLPGSGLVGSEVPLSGETTSAPLSLAPDSGGGSSVSDAAPLSLRSASTARNRFGSFKGNVSNESLPARTIEEPPQEDTSNEALPAAADEELPHESDFDGYLAKDGKVDSRSRHEVSVHEHELEEQLAAQVAELDHLHVIEETDRLGILQLQQYAARLQQVIEEQAAAAKGGQQAQQAREVEFMREETSAYRKQMQQLSDEIVELQRIRDSERQHAKEQLRDMASGFQKAVDEVQAQTEDARKQIEEWRARTLEAEEARQTAEQNSDTLEEEMNQMRVIEKDLNARLHQVQDELRQSGLERDRLQEQLRKLVEHNAVLQELADGLEKTPQMTNQAMEEELVMARSKIQVLNDELESGNTLLRRQEDELATLRVRVESTVEPARTCGDEQLESLLEKEIARADDLQREVMKLKVDIITYDEQYDNDWQEKLTYQKEALIKDMLDTRKDLKAALSDKEDLELQLRNAQQEKSELSVAVEHGIMKARADRDILEGTLAEAKDATQVDQVKQQNRQLSEQLRVCQGDLEDLKQRYIKVVSRNSEIEEKMREIALHEKRMSDDILSMQQERDEVTKEREKLEDVSSSREESIRQLEQAKRMLESELSGSINEMRTKVSEVNALQGRLRELTDDYGTSEKELTLARRQLETYLADNKTLMEENKSLVSRVDHLEGLLKMSKEQREAIHDEKVELETLSRKLDQERETAILQRDALDGERTTLRVQLQGLNEKISQHEKSLQQQHEKIDMLTAEKKALQKQLERALQEVQRLVPELKKLQDEFKNHKTKTATAEKTLSQDVLKALKERDALSTRLSQTQKALSGSEAKVESLTTAHNTLKVDFEENNSQLGTLKGRHKALQDVLATEKKAKASISDAHTKVTEEYNAVRMDAEGLRKKMAQQEQQLKGGEAQRKALQGNVDRLTKEVQNLQEERKAIEAKLQAPKEGGKSTGPASSSPSDSNFVQSVDRVAVERDRLSSSLEAAQRELKTMKGTVAARDRDLNEAGKVAASLETQLEKIRGERDMLQESLERARKEVATTRKELSTGIATRADIEQELSVLRSDKSLLDARVQNLLGNLQVATEELQKTGAENTSVSATLLELRGAITELESKVAGQQQDVSSAIQEKNRALATVKMRDGELESNAAELQGLRGIVQREQVESKKALNRLNVATEEHRKLQLAKDDVISELEKSLAETNTRLQTRTAEFHSVARELESTKLELAGRVQDLQLAQMQLQGAVAEGKKMSERVKRVEDQRAELQAAHDTAIDHSQAQAKALSTATHQAGKSARTISELTEKIGELDGEMRSLRLELQSSHDMAKQLKFDALNNEKLIEKLEAAHRTEKQEHQRAAAVAADWKDKESHARALEHKVRIELEHTQATVEGLQKKSAKVDEELVKAKQSLALSDTELKRLSHDLSTVESEKQEVMQKLDAMTRERDALAVRMEKVREEVAERLVEEVAQGGAAVDNAVNKALKEREETRRTELDQLVAQLESSDAALHTARRGFVKISEEKTNLQLLIDTANAQVVSLTARLEVLHGADLKARQEVESLQLTLAERDSELQLMKSRHKGVEEDLRATRDQARAAINELESTKHELIRERRRAEGEANSLREREEMMESERHLASTKHQMLLEEKLGLRHELEVVKTELQVVQRQVASAQDSRNKASAETTAMQRALDEANAELKSVKEALALSKSRADESSGEAQELLRRLQVAEMEGKQAVVETGRLTEELARVNRELQTQRAEAASLSGRLMSMEAASGDYSEEVKVIRQELEQVRGERHKLHEQMKSKEAELAAVLDQTHSLQASSSAGNLEIEAAGREIKVLKARVLKAEAAEKDAVSQAAAANKAAAQASSQAKATAAEIARLKGQAEEARAEAQRQAAQLSSISRSQKQTGPGQAPHSADSQNLKRQLEARDADLAARDREVKALSKRLAEAEAAAEGAVATSDGGDGQRKRLVEELEASKELIEDLKKQRAMMADELVDRKMMLEEAMRNAEKTMEGAEQVVHTKNQEIVTLKGEKMRLDMEMAMHRAEKEAIMEDRTKLQRQMMAAQGDIESLREKVAALESAKT